MKKAVLTFFTVCLLSTVFLIELSFNVQPVKASGTIYIRADGSVEPETAPISSVDNVTYTFTDNIYDEIVVERNNIVVDGSGYTLQGQGIGCGFFLDSINNVTIKRTLIKRFSKGIMLNSSSFNVVSENNITDNWDGVDLYWSSSNTISGNDITNNGWGVTLHSSSNNTIITNNITKHLYASERTPVGVQLFLSSNNTISGNNVTNNYSGVHLHESSFNTICGNDITNTPYRSLYLFASFNNTIYRNKITNNGYSVYFHSSSFNLVSENNIINNSYGVMLYWSSNNNIASGNKITNNSYGFASNGGIVSYENGTRFYYLSSNNTISGNNVTNNHLGVKLYLSFSNIIYHNNFINNTQQVYDYSWDHPEFSPSINSWDADYPSGGNYWSNYTGTDENHDGVGDAPHIIDVNNTDNYPLMGTFSDFSATSEYHVQTICNSAISDFQFNGTAISFHVTGENGTTGFCRICIPTALMNDTFRMFVNGTEILPSPEPLPFSNSTHNYLYINYSQSTQEVIIVPEFPSFLILPLFILSALLAVIVYKRIRMSRKMK